MWLIDRKTFDNSEGDLARARQSIARATRLVVIVGNSPSRASAHLDALRNASSTGRREVGWAAAVHEAAEASPDIPKDLRTPSANLLALAQAVVGRTGSSGKRRLLAGLAKEFGRALPTTLIHEMLVALSPPAIVTTNYDLQLERAFAGRGRPWHAFIRNAAPQVSTGTHIYKMHGTIEPDDGTTERYLFARPEWEKEPIGSIVISETDYDECLAELLANANHPVIAAIRSADCLLLLGKAIDWQDVSFMYALRATRPTLPERNAFCICLAASSEEKLNLFNLGITPLVVGLPSRPRNDHYYLALCKALRSLIPEHTEPYEPAIATFARERRLIEPPAFVAMGLVAHNTIGRISHHGAEALADGERYTLLAAGRRNLRLEAEDVPGGAALTAVAAFAALDEARHYPRSIISAMHDGDPFAASIRRFCDDWEIDADGLSGKGGSMWHSTVLVHDVPTAKALFPGQRVFLDSGRLFDPPLDDNDQIAHQLGRLVDTDRAQQSELPGVVYLDKFLAQPYGAKQSVLEVNRSTMDRLVDSDVDVLYETGSTGSRGGAAEEAVRPYVNVIVASFPFFAHNILLRSWNPGLGWSQRYRQEGWTAASFAEEIAAIDGFLTLLGSSLDQPTDVEIRGAALEQWLGTAREMLRRRHSRRWLIVTLHHQGAFSVDLDRGVGYHCVVPRPLRARVVNTTGAGDTLRGAFCFALLKSRQIVGLTPERALRLCTAFSLRVASEKCTVFSAIDALKHIRSNGPKWWHEAVAATESSVDPLDSHGSRGRSGSPDRAPVEIEDA